MAWTHTGETVNKRRAGVKRRAPPVINALGGLTMRRGIPSGLLRRRGELLIRRGAR